MALIQTRGNVNVYVRQPPASPTAFAAADKLVASQIYELSTTINGDSFEFGGYGALYKNRVADIKDFTVSFKYDVDPADTLLSTLLARWNSTDRKADILIVAGDVPAAGAKNIAAWGRFVLTAFTLETNLPGLVRVSLSAGVADGSTINLAINQTALPSL